ncbi:hypothetical protein BDBG_17103 [Blastomyces gilchristii SLH14081]|uniref:2'-phosphotransferase n=1 Tax=Blastomyces gilchristii (strain SLH14081) TaxID=559298 RepID=A0A179UNW7_BLAGS|nr:uncharacterized protein BDBG_17103 [Blastomyces gilchristii SLH14081]OAT08731.1 hypothetical protein BDBG_17103 [Blastomyces gilchristii SLH14081]
MSHSRRGRDHGRGHGAGRSEPGREVVVSKALSYILRHAAEREGVKIDSHGYANVADVASQTNPPPSKNGAVHQIPNKV